MNCLMPFRIIIEKMFNGAQTISGGHGGARGKREAHKGMGIDWSRTVCVQCVIWAWLAFWLLSSPALTSFWDFLSTNFSWSASTYGIIPGEFSLCGDSLSQWDHRDDICLSPLKQAFIQVNLMPQAGDGIMMTFVHAEKKKKRDEICISLTSWLAAFSWVHACVGFGKYSSGVTGYTVAFPLQALKGCGRVVSSWCWEPAFSEGNAKATACPRMEAAPVAQTF